MIPTFSAKDKTDKCDAVSNQGLILEAGQQPHTLYRLGEGVRRGTRQELVESASEQVERLLTIPMNNEQSLYITVHITAFGIMGGKRQTTNSLFNPLLNPKTPCCTPLIHKHTTIRE
jgi:hypothetical protein